MIQSLILSADVRETSGRKTDSLRTEGKIPAVVYGFETEPVKITLDRNTVEKLYSEAGESTVIDLDVNGSHHNVLIQDIQRDALTGFIIHADFRAIDMTKLVEATISLKLIGESPAVKELGGTLVQSLEEVEVQALPIALVSSIDVDAATLTTFESVIRVKDISIPEGIEILTDLERTVATVQAPRSEEEMAALDEAVEIDVDAVEVESGKAEETEGGESEDVKEQASE